MEGQRFDREVILVEVKKGGQCPEFMNTKNTNKAEMMDKVYDGFLSVAALTTMNQIMSMEDGLL
jgi:hypothetical protein